MRRRFRAPATSANLGPGFDCAGVALDLWNELVVSDEADAAGPDSSHLAVQAFARLHSADGLSFSFTDRVPRGRGLGSSAACVALGLVAGAALSGRLLAVEELLAIGLDLEGHADNLAAALAGGVCLTWSGRVARLAEELPAKAVVVVVPAEQVATAASRAALPATVAHADAAYSSARALLLGAGLAGQSSELFAAALDDRLHEPYRQGPDSLLTRLRAELPAGALGATLSGSGPSVVVWAAPGQEQDVSAALAELVPAAQVLVLAVTPVGAQEVAEVAASGRAG